MSTVFALDNRVEISGFEDNPITGRNNAFVLQTFMHAYNTSSAIKIAVDAWLYANPTKNIQIIYSEGKANAVGIPGPVWNPTGEILIDPEFDSYYVNDKGSVSKDSFMGTLIHELSHVVNEVRDDDYINNLKGSNIVIANEWFDDLGIDRQASYDAAETELNILKENFQYTNGIEIENAIIGKLSLVLEDGSFDPRNMNASNIGITGSTLYIGSLESDIFSVVDSIHADFIGNGLIEHDIAP